MPGEQSMLLQTGTKIPDGQLCLTFDDGPGPHTSDISTYLREEQIPATFFLIGNLIAARQQIVQQLLDDGHEIGNHTQDHHKLTETWDEGSQICDAHEQLRPFIATREHPFFFRPPYGCWPTHPGLNEELTKQGERLGELYSGPVPWDFDGDWRFWGRANGANDAEALRDAVACYAPVRRGIVLMHDNSAEPHIGAKNQTFRMIKQLIPAWKAQGRSFVSLRAAYRAGFLDVAM
jgi:peptidoglycan/xylan/chitin deacetylase (PgdA/CDA1 family)